MKYQLKDICSITKGATGIMKAIPGKYPLVALSDERRSHNEFQFDANAVIVPLISSTGHGHASMKRVHYQEGKFALGNILCALIPKDEKQLNAKYLHLYLQQFKETLLVPLMKGAANVSLPMNKLADVEIEVPGLERQLEIIALEDKAAELKNELEEKLILQDGDVTKLRQTILREAIQGKLVKQVAEEGNATNLLKIIGTEKEKLVADKRTKHTFPLHKKAKKAPPFHLPPTWEWVRFWDIAWCFRGHNPPKMYFKKESQKGYVRFVQITDFKTEGQAVYVPISKSLKLVSKGEIIMAAYRHIGKLSRNMEGAFNVALCKINNIEPFDRDYLELVIKSDLITGELLDASERGHIPSMHSEHLLSLWVPVPPLLEQHRIVKKFDQLMQLCDELQHSIQQSKIENEKLLQGALRDALKKEEVITT